MGRVAELRCNSSDLGLVEPPPVGVFLARASLDGCLETSGNVWEWTNSLYSDYPCQAEDGREDLTASGARVVRGGSFDYNTRYVGCADRLNFYPSSRGDLYGFRVCVSREP